MKKLPFILFLFLGITFSAQSQSKKAIERIEKKATEIVEKINNEIIAGDKTLALTDEQKEQIKKLHVKRITALKELGKDASKEAKKAINKKYYTKMYKDLITNKQLKARRKAKKEAKA